MKDGFLFLDLFKPDFRLVSCFFVNVICRDALLECCVRDCGEVVSDR